MGNCSMKGKHLQRQQLDDRCVVELLEKHDQMRRIADQQLTALENGRKDIMSEHALVNGMMYEK